MSAANELELEAELSALESEGEFELAGELESELELAQELVGEFELEHEHEAEHEAFFNSLAAMADRRGRSQALRRIALAAARAALRGQTGRWPIVEGEMGEFEGELGEFELAGEYEFEFETSPARLIQAYAEMEHEGHAAAEAANEQEAAEHFLPLIGLAAKFVLPKIAGLAAKKLGAGALQKVGGRLAGRAASQLLRRVGPRLLRRVTPQLTRGVANVTRTLFRSPATRPLLHAMPRIARGTVARLAAHVARGRRITPRLAVRTLAQQTARTLGSPRVLARSYRRSRAWDRRYHQRTRRVLGRPTGAAVRAAAARAALPINPAMVSAGAAAGAAGGMIAPRMPMGGPAGIGAFLPGAGGGAVAGNGGCRCSGQPAANGMASMAAAQPAMAAMMAMPQAAATCPACGR